MTYSCQETTVQRSYASFVLFILGLYGIHD